MKKLLILPLIVMTSACMGGQSQTLDSKFQSKFKAEIAAWEEVEGVFPESCLKGETDFPPPKNKVVQYTKCKTSLVNQKVMAVAAYPDLVIDMRATALRNADLYARGKISETEFEARGNENFSDYLKAVDARYYATMNQSIQQDQIAAQNTQRALQSIASMNAASNPLGTPAASCRFNPATGRNQQCLHILADGACAHFAMPC